jgi:hypothetical protein
MLVGPSIGGIKMRLQNYFNADVSIGLELMFKPTMASTIAFHEGFFLSCFTYLVWYCHMIDMLRRGL